MYSRLALLGLAVLVSVSTERPKAEPEVDFSPEPLNVDRWAEPEPIRVEWIGRIEPDLAGPGGDVVERNASPSPRAVAVGPRPAPPAPPVRIERVDPLRPLFDAMAFVESGNRPWAVGRNGRDRGPYQISVLYWRDACRYGGVDWDYYTWVWDKARCEQVMRWYWQKYGAESWEAMARLHNGGPKYHGKHATVRYWRRVQRQLARQ